MTTAEKITLEDDWMICLCGNDPSLDGFLPCLDDGTPVEPADDGPWQGRLYVCGRCGRIVDYPTLEVRGHRAVQEVWAIANGETVHTQCPPGSHTFDAGDDHYEGRVDEHGNQRCNDCAAAMFYCTVDNQYHHVQGPGDEVKPCFLIQEQAWPVPAPQPGEHIYEPDAADRSKWTCIRHQGQPCPPLDTAVLTRATAYPAPPEPETCFCGGKVRYGRCRECDTLYGQSEDDQ